MTVQSLFAEEPSPSLAPDLGLRWYQQAARDAVHAVLARSRGALVVHPTGCHRAGQGILMADGSVKLVEDVVVGDKLMGPDSTPRTVLSLARGHQAMVEIRPTKGDPWVVNMDHVLSLVTTNGGGSCPSDRGGRIRDVTCREWLRSWSNNAKHMHKLFRVPVNFPEMQSPTISPYVLGVILGDGALTKGTVTVSKPDQEIFAACAAEATRFDVAISDRNGSGGRCRTFGFSRRPGTAQENPISAELRSMGLLPISCERRFVPHNYKRGSRQTRLEVLAGLLDTDGHLSGGCFDFISKSPLMARDVAFIARSLGFAAYITKCTKSCQGGFTGVYHRVCISGDVHLIPTRIPRKQASPRKQKKDPLRTGLQVVPTGTIENYYGFTLDGDQRYLLEDFTVTHNCGKSRLAAAVAWDCRLAGGKVLILTPTITLTLQMYADVRQAGLTAGIEQASNRVFRPLPSVTVACVDTMRGARLKSFARDDFALIIADEAHRSTSSKYAAIFSYFEGAKLLGLTATPDRADGVSLRNVFDELAHELTMLQAIKEGWLTPLRFKTAVTAFDAKRLRTLAGEVDAGSVAEEITRSGLLHEAASSLAELANGERTVAFLPTVASSKAFVAEMHARGVPAQHIDGTTPAEYREHVFKLFVSGETRVLSNVGVLTEGWDCPAASVIALLNPTKSRSRVAQMIGRGTRLMEGKASTLVIDFCPGRLRKGRLASPADAMAGKMLDDSVADHLPAEGDLAAAIELAEKTALDVQQKKEEAAERARQRAERIARMKSLVTVREQVDYRVQDHDALDMLSRDGANNDVEPLREKQLTARPQLTNEQRVRAGLATEKQAKILARHGMNPYLKRKLANEAIDAIESNGWKLPEHIRTDKRFYAGTKERVELEERALAKLKKLGLAG